MFLTYGDNNNNSHNEGMIVEEWKDIRTYPIPDLGGCVILENWFQLSFTFEDQSAGHIINYCLKIKILVYDSELVHLY